MIKYVVQINTVDGPCYWQSRDIATDRIEEAHRFASWGGADNRCTLLRQAHAFLGSEGGSYRVVEYVLDGVMRDLAVELEPMDYEDIAYCNAVAGGSLDCVEDAKYRIYSWCESEDDRGELQLDPMSPHAVY